MTNLWRLRHVTVARSYRCLARTFRTRWAHADSKAPAAHRSCAFRNDSIERLWSVVWKWTRIGPPSRIPLRFHFDASLETDGGRGAKRLRLVRDWSERVPPSIKGSIGWVRVPAAKNRLTLPWGAHRIKPYPYYLMRHRALPQTGSWLDNTFPSNNQTDHLKLSDQYRTELRPCKIIPLVQ